MQQEKKNKRLSILFWILSVVCMGVIFWLSSRTSDESSLQSAAVLEWLIRLFGDNIFTDFIVRKLAHCLEFTGLCLLINCALYFSKGRTLPIYAIAITSAYAVTDELHQLFVEGRSCELRDWCIDTLGAAMGAIGFLVLYLIIKRILKFIDTKNN